MLYSKRASWLAIKLLPHTFSEDFEDILPLYSSTLCFREKYKDGWIFSPKDELTFFPGYRISSLFLRFNDSNKIHPLLMDLSQLVWGLLVLSICIFKYLFQNCFPYLTSLGNLYVVFILFVNPRHQFCIHWISFVIFLPIIFYSMILNFVFFFSILFCSGFLKPVLYVPKHYCGRAYFLLTYSKIIFTYRMTLFFSSAFT